MVDAHIVARIVVCMYGEAQSCYEEAQIQNPLSSISTIPTVVRPDSAGIGMVEEEALAGYSVNIMHTIYMIYA